MKSFIPLRFITVYIVLTFIFSTSILHAQFPSIDGTYELIGDNDGSTPKTGAVIAMVFQTGQVTLIAKMPSNHVEGEGKYTISNNRITVVFEDFDFGCTNLPFTHEHGILTLPFAVLGGEIGTSSEWKQVAYADGTPFNNQQSGGSGTGSSAQGSGSSGSGQASTGNQGQAQGSGTSSGSGQAAGNIPSDSFSDYPAKHYEGRWYGSGWGWEVRFKHTSGDFVSQFAGIEKGDLPFDNEKVIMSLTVQHGVSFYIDVDKNGKITGEGTIMYDLIPNLCAVAALTQAVNSAINMLEKVGSLFQLSGKIAQAAVQDMNFTFLGMKGNLAKAAQMSSDAFGSKPYNYLVDKVEETIQKLYLNHHKRDVLCQCAAGMPVQGAGTQVGPSTLDELISEFGVNLAKSMFGNITSVSAPVGMMLAVPGITQVQYNYKGMVDRPQKRTFKITGKIIDGEMYLDAPKIQGDNNLWVEYMVNYQTDKSSFPVWSPFLSAPGIVKPAGLLTIYEHEEFEHEADYTDPITGKKQKMKVMDQRLVAKDEIFHTPFASFYEAGTQRNNVSVWHEYEYHWSVFKFKE
jgi:hypothetical protein